jgi:flavin-dependent dehydrogenase
MHYDAIIVGGGLAGASAAILLAEQGRRVLLLEQQRYPVHKLCGEFLSVEVQEVFARLGVLAAVQEAGARPIRHTRLTTADGAVFEARLPGTALGLSRYVLDPLLVGRAQALGVEVREGCAVQAVQGGFHEGFTVQTGQGTFTARLVLGAWGKREALDRKLRRPFMQEQSPFVAFKAHFEGLDLGDGIELHAFPGGYCGLSPIEGGRVNACWIAHRTVLQADGGRPEAMMAGAFRQNPALAERLDRLRRVTGFCAVSQVRFARKETFCGDLCLLGDAAGTIAPLCGDGMAMALRSAELAAPPALAYLDGRHTPEAFRQHYTQAWEAAFTLRLRLGRWLHYGYIHPLLAGWALRALRQVPGVGHWLIRKTRG